MGLDFVGADAHWSYSSFNSFRHKLAKEVGIDLDEMDGFGGRKSWARVKTPLKWLLNHSDCDGQITAKRCAKMAPILRGAVLQWVNLKEHEYDLEQALELAEGMRECGRRNKPLIFC